MSISAGKKSAFTIIEVLIASALGLLLASVIVILSLYSSRSFLAIGNYTTMNQRSQLALDKMSKDIRQARSLTAYTNNSLTFSDVDGNSLQYTYNASAGTLVRVRGGQSTTYLTNCDALQFFIYQHTPISNSFDCYTPGNVASARVIQLTWKCSLPIRGTKATTESIESAQFVLRNH